MKYMEMMGQDTDFVNNLVKVLLQTTGPHTLSLSSSLQKLSPPLVTLLSSEPEVQYVALRNINLIIQKRPDILKHEMKVFFVKYNDPIYIKLEKLDIMIRLTSQANIAQVLSELKVTCVLCLVPPHSQYIRNTPRRLTWTLSANLFEPLAGVPSRWDHC